MVDSKENYKFDLGVRWLKVKGRFSFTLSVKFRSFNGMNNIFQYTPLLNQHKFWQEIVGAQYSTVFFPLITKLFKKGIGLSMVLNLLTFRDSYSRQTTRAESVVISWTYSFIYFSCFAALFHFGSPSQAMLTEKRLSAAS